MKLGARSLAPARLEAPLGFRIWRSDEVGPMSCPHTHADIELNFICRGAMGYRHGGVDEDLRRGDLGIFWGGIPHQLLRVDDVALILITLPILWFLRWDIPGGLAARLMAGEMVKVRADEAPFARWRDDFQSRQPVRLRALQLELEAMFQRTSLSAKSRSLRGSSRAQVSRGRSLRIEQVTSFLALHYKEELSLARIAGAVSVHPKYLARVFKSHCGLSVWEYLTRLRVAHAQRLLRTTDEKIIDVALESGFGSVAPFYSAFERYANGQSPRKFRLKDGR